MVQFTENVKAIFNLFHFPQVLLLSFYLNVNPSYTANRIKDNEEPLFQLFPKIRTLLLYGSR